MAPLPGLASSPRKLPVCREGKPDTTLPDHAGRAPWATRASQNPDHISGSISSLLVASDIANDVGDVLVAFFLIGDEGGIVVLVVFNRFIDLDVVLGFRNDRLDLAGVFLGIGFLERYQLLGLRRFGCGVGGCHGAGAGGLTTTPARRRRLCDRHDLAGIGRYHRILVEVVKFLTRRRANAFGSEIGFGHGGILGNFSKSGASLG